MRIRYLKARNFLTFGDGPIELRDLGSLNTIVGPNNSGKTNLFRVVSFVSTILTDRATDVLPYFRNGDIENPIEVELCINLNEEETQALADFLMCSTFLEHVNPKQGENPERLLRVRNAILRKNQSIFENMFSNKSIAIIVETKGRMSYAPEIYFRIFDQLSELYLLGYRDLTSSPPGYYGATYSTNFAELLVDEARSLHPVEFREYIAPTATATAADSDPSFVEQVAQLDMNWVLSHLNAPPALKSDLGYPKRINIQGFSFADYEGQPGSPLGASLPEPHLRLRKFLKRRGFASVEQLNVVTLLAIVLETSFVRIEDIRSGPNGVIPDDFESIPIRPSHLDGSELALLLFRLKNSGDREDRKRFQQIQDKFTDIMKPLTFDIHLESVYPRSSHGPQPGNPYLPIQEATQQAGDSSMRASPENAVQQMVPVISVDNGRFSAPIEFAAAGAVEVLLILTAFVGLRDSCILLDEPAVNLHPSMQRKLLEHLNASIEESSNQVFIITHSPYLVSEKHLEHLWRLSADGDSTSKISNVGKVLSSMSTDSDEARKIGLQLGKADIRALLFSKGVIFVEGPTDKYVVERIDDFLVSKGKRTADIEGNEWSVIEVGGKDHLWLFINLARSFGIEFVGIVDYDALMFCDAKIEIPGGKELRTSPLVRALHSNELLSPTDLERLSQLQNEIKHESNGSYWYSNDKIDLLFSLAEQHNFFVFCRDMEGALQMRRPPKRNKPLKAIEVVEEMLESGEIKAEFARMIDFLKSKI
jgi:AAA15 family ATPase/GTPase